MRWKIKKYEIENIDVSNHFGWVALHTTAYL